MIRGTLANIRLPQPAGARHRERRHRDFTSNANGQHSVTTVFEASEKYLEAGTPLVVLAGKEYGSGSSRDWAAKGTALLGVRAVIAESLRADPPVEPDRDGRAAADSTRRVGVAESLGISVRRRSRSRGSRS